MKTIFSIRIILILVAVLVFGCGAKSVFAETSPSVLYVPLIGITSVPDPLSLPGGAGNVTYNYAVKNFLKEVPLTNVQVVDDTCGSVTFANGDDNGDGKLDYSETWRYVCVTKLSQTTQSIATATGSANNITATHRAYATVVVGSSNQPPLVSIVNITKVVYPLYLPVGGGNITFTYKVTNPGVIALNNVVVTDDACSAMSGKLGDTNGNDLLDANEVWIYTCSTSLTQTTTSTANVTAFANGLKAIDYATLTVNVGALGAGSATNLFDVGINPVVGANSDAKIMIWGTLLGALVILIICFFLIRKK